MIGRRLSHYEIVDEIGRGGMGVVYRAVDVNLGREVALKVLPEDLGHDPARRERLLQEARSASTLEHPNIAVIHEVGDADGVTFLAMELIRGEKLSDTLARGPLLQTRALDLATEIAEGLARAHEKGIIHRDLKPANVMVTDDGHAKIIDFGLAKLVKPLSPGDQDAATASAHGPQTGPGVILGTAAYMSPEQARGGRIDERSDVFAFGLTLYEMVTGRSAFRGPSELDTLQAILSQQVPPLPTGSGPTADTTAEVQRIIAKSTAKDPDARFQGMKDLVVDLRAVRRRAESSETNPLVPAAASLPATPPRPSSRRGRMLAGAALALAIGVAGYLWWAARRPAATTIPSGKPAVAVLYFENNTGDATLDWMRTGLTDMMVNDLSQSTDFEVIGTDRLVQILQDLRRSNDRVIAADVVQEIAHRAGVDNVLVGNYVKSAGTIRISARLQDARTGRIVTAERVEGPGESGVFSLVDELTRRFKSKMTAIAGVPVGPLLRQPGAAAPAAGLDRGLTEITTTSMEAYRYYAEGLNLHERNLSAQAAPLLEKAVQIDPDFAMAYAKLAVVMNNLVLFDKRETYAKRALDLSARLTPRERYYIEGFYYGLRPETIDRSIQAYQQGLALHPEHEAMRHNLALTLFTLERFDEGIAQSEELLRRGTSNPTTYENLAESLVQVGNLRRAREVAEQLAALHPENAAGMRVLAMTMAVDGHLDEARPIYEKSASLDPLDQGTRIGLRSLGLLQERWTAAGDVNQEFVKSASPFQRYMGFVGNGQIAAAHGLGQAALENWDRAARVTGLAPSQRAVARNLQAMLLLRLGKPASALAQSEAALIDARNRNQEFETLQFLAVAQAGTGRNADSDKTLALLESRARTLLGGKELRRAHWARGAIALAQGDAGAAVSELTRAAEMLPAHGFMLGPPMPHATFWLFAALADIKAGRDVQAAAWLERLQSAYEHQYDMDAYGRSFYLLAGIYERRGDRAKAREQYTRFVNLWRDGDVERGWVADAQLKIAR